MPRILPTTFVRPLAVETITFETIPHPAYKVVDGNGKELFGIAFFDVTFAATLAERLDRDPDVLVPLRAAVRSFMDASEEALWIN